MNVRVPDNTKRTMVVGRTGSGKSHGSIDLLEQQDWDSIPWVIIDFKGEDLLEEILHRNKHAIKHISVQNNPPKQPGLYYMRCNPLVDDDAMEAWLLKVHKQGNLGLFIDEGYAMPKFGSTPGFTLILTQGRSLHIPVICLYQRPVWMSRFAIAQADFIRVFKQGDERDEKVTKNFCRPAILPDGSKLGPLELDKLPDYYSLWHDVGQGRTNVLKPARSKREILDGFKDKLQPKRKGMFI
jgi:hypothetical protein